jgi:methyl-accepting chemotaxis protein
MLTHRRIGTRLALGFGSLIVAAVAGFGAAAWLGSSGQAAISEAGGIAQARIDAVHAMQDNQLTLVSAIRNAGLQTDGAQINADVSSYRKALAELSKLEQQFAKTPLSAQERQVLDKAMALRKQAEPIVDEAVRFTMALDGEQAAKVLTSRFAPVQAQWAAELGELAQLQRRQAQASAEAITASNGRQLALLAGALLLVVAGAVGFAVLLTRSVTRPLGEAAAIATRVAEGDLSVRIDVKGQDETAQLMLALQTMTRQLAGMVQAVRETSTTILHASSEISSGNQIGRASCRERVS